MTQATDVAFAARRTGDVRLIGGVSAAHFVSHFYMLVLPPLFVVIQGEYGVSYTELGLCFTVFNGASALLQTQAGFLVDRSSARMILAAGLLIEAAAFVVAAAFHSYWVLVAMFAVMGIGNTVFHPADYALLSHRVSPARMSQAYSMHGFAGMLGSAAAPAAVLMMYGWFGWRGAFLGTAIFGAIAVLIVLFLIDDAPEQTAKPRSSADADSDRSLLLSPPIMINFVFFLLLALASFGLQNFLVVGLSALHGTDPVTANAALSGNLLMSAFGVLIGGWIASRITHHRLLASIGLCIATVVPTLLMTHFDLSAALLVAVMSVAGVFYGAVMPSRDMIVREVTPPGAFGKVFGFVTNGFNIAGIVAPLLFGALLDHGAPLTFFYVIAVFGVASIVAVACVPKRRAA